VIRVNRWHVTRIHEISPIVPSRTGGLSCGALSGLGFVLPVVGVVVDLLIGSVIAAEEIRRHMREEQANLDGLLSEVESGSDHGASER
jgi:hypothetical protein